MAKQPIRGHRRHSAPPGYISSTEAVKKLGKMLYKHVEAGRIRKITPDGFKHGFYHAGDVEAVLATEQLFSPQYEKGAWKLHPSSTFELATMADMPAIVEISRHIFGDPTIAIETRSAWLQKNSETFYVLRNQERVIVGYASLLPLKQGVITRVIHDAIEAQEITDDDIEEFTPGKPLHIYIMAIGVDPQYTGHEKHEYGARLVSGLFTFLLDLAQRGVEIETITARSHKPDGLRILRKLGFPQLRSPIPGKSLFVVRVAESGFPVLVRYSEFLAHWQREHIPHTPIATTRQKRVTTPKIGTPAQEGLPEGLVGWRDFAKQHAIAESTVQKAIKTGRLPIIEGRWKSGKAWIQGALDEQGRTRFFELWPHARPTS